MKAVIYLRVSTKEQAEEGYSIPAQAEACRRFIADQGWELADEYVDRGESARTADRPQLTAMLAHLADGVLALNCDFTGEVALGGGPDHL